MRRAGCAARSQGSARGRKPTSSRCTIPALTPAPSCSPSPDPPSTARSNAHVRGVGLAVFRGEPGPTGQLRGPGEAGDVADRGDEHRGQRRTDPGDGLDRPVPAVIPQPACDALGEQLDLEVQALQHPGGRTDPDPGTRRRRQLEPVPTDAGPRGRTGHSPAPRSRPALRALGTSRSSATRPAWPGWRTSLRSSRTSDGAIHASGCGHCDARSSSMSGTSGDAC